jgi:hypothetical protein
MDGWSECKEGKVCERDRLIDRERERESEKFIDNQSIERERERGRERERERRRGHTSFFLQYTCLFFKRNRAGTQGRPRERGGGGSVSKHHV